MLNLSPTKTTNKMEEFRDVKGFESYRVSNIGRVKSMKYGKERIMKLSVNNSGYLQVNLSRNGKVYSRRVHKLVAIAFLGHVPDGYNIVVDHISGEKTNNKVSNLQLITQRENTSKDRKGGTSQYVGVCWSKTRGDWIAKTYANKKHIYIGYFATELQASEAYQLTVKKLTHEV